jgi:hypothetical protein
MLIESYALDAAWTLAQMISFIVGLESPPQSKIQNHSMATFNLLAGSQDSIRVSLSVQQTEFFDDSVHVALVFRSLLIFLLFIE